MTDTYPMLMDCVRDVGRLRAIGQLLEWDQETYMPSKGVSARAEQVALIAGLSHDLLISDKTRLLLDKASAPDGDFVAETNLRETRRLVERAVRIPTELVKEIAQVSSLAKDVWVQAKKQSRFSLFAPHLARLLELKRRVAECVGYEGEPYDALLDEFEPSARAEPIANLFSRLQEATVSLLREIQSSPNQPDGTILTRHFPRAGQEQFARRLADAVHYDFEAGRVDVSVHPFCITIGGNGDVRITTRYEENFLPAALFGTLHEAGHALYEQGLGSEHVFTPMGEAVSMGIHESQSRMWENLVGRSRGFWTFHWPGLREVFPDALADVSSDEFHRAINAVRPSLIRVEADELTYNLHIILRFNIERALVRGELDIEDVPAAWNEAVSKTVGISPGNDADGCLQDIHWTLGAFGYFPTYALGNLYAAQFFEAARRDIPDLDRRVAANDHRPLLDWLRGNIHRHGQRYRADELVQVVTGKPLSIEPFVRYLTDKFSELYGLPQAC